MESRYCLVTISSLVIFLLVLAALGYLLFNYGREYYLQLNAVRLDPLGLSYYDTAPEQPDSVNTDLATVLFFGDSRAASWPAPSVDRFEFVNRGIGAQTSEQTALRFEYHVKPLRPRVVVVQVGINDLKTIPLFPGQEESIIADCKENIRQIVSAANELGATVIVSTVFPPGQVPIKRRPFWSDDVVPALEQVNAYIRSLEGENVLVFDAYAILLGEDGMIDPGYSQDMLHLNARGYEKLNVELAYLLTAMDH